MCSTHAHLELDGNSPKERQGCCLVPIRDVVRSDVKDAAIH